MIARGLLNSIADKASYVPYFINFSAQTSSKRTQEMIESKLEKKRKTVLGKYERFNGFRICIDMLRYIHFSETSYCDS